MLLSTSKLLEYYTQEQIEQSTYQLQGRTYIRLVNSNPANAHIPAILNNVKENREFISKFSNVTKRRKDTINNVLVQNTKIDADITSQLEVIIKPTLPNVGLTTTEVVMLAPKLKWLRDTYIIPRHILGKMNIVDSYYSLDDINELIELVKGDARYYTDEDYELIKAVTKLIEAEVV